MQETALHRTGSGCSTERIGIPRCVPKWGVEALRPFPPPGQKDLGIHGQVPQTVRSLSEAAERRSYWI